MNNFSQKDINTLVGELQDKSYNLIDFYKLDDLTNLTQDSRKHSVLFFNITDEKKFWNFIGDVDYGLLIVSKDIEGLKNKVNVIVVKENSFLSVQKIFCDEFYPNNKSITFVGVTGTNGKTTVTTLCSQIAGQLNKRAYALGTMGVFDGKKILEELNQTLPSYIDLRKIIYKYQGEIECLFIEVSSHGLKQDRLFDLILDQIAWTNLTQDHLDYHKNMEDYFETKLSITERSSNTLIIAREQILLHEKVKSNNIEFILPKSLEQRKLKVESKFLMAPFNQSNLELALELCEKLWGDIDGVNINEIKAPKGRFSTIELSENKFVIIDYAHTPDALENILKAVSIGFSNYKVKVLFGCGGDRDKLKRKVMGDVAKKNSDFSYITSDNPRTENPRVILDHILEAYDSYENYYANVDRKETIHKALKELYNNEILVIAGKGHEEYQDINGKKIHFSDFEVVKEYMND